MGIRYLLCHQAALPRVTHCSRWAVTGDETIAGSVSVLIYVKTSIKSFLPTRMGGECLPWELVKGLVSISFALVRDLLKWTIILELRGT